MILAVIMFSLVFVIWMAIAGRSEIYDHRYDEIDAARRSNDEEDNDERR